jgi:hypothetical protein
MSFFDFRHTTTLGGNTQIYQLISVPQVEIVFPGGSVPAAWDLLVFDTQPNPSWKVPLNDLLATSTLGLARTQSGRLCAATRGYGLQRPTLLQQSPDVIAALGAMYSSSSSAILHATGSVAFPAIPSPVDNVAVLLEEHGRNMTLPPIVTAASQPAGVASVECVIDGELKSVGVESLGAGFSSPPSVHFIGGGGSGGAAVAMIEGPVGEVHVTAGGSGYIAPPIVRMTGLGIHGTATATINAGAVTAISVATGGAYRNSPPSIEIVPQKSLAGITVTSGGNGYSSPPTVVICHAGGATSAAATATISAQVVSVLVQSGGNGYSADEPPEVEFLPEDGHGAGASASAVVDPDSGRITSVQVTAGGSGYRAAPVVRVSGGARLTATIAGQVDSVSVTALGYGFSEPPAILFQGGGGTGAAASSAVAPYGGGAAAIAKLSAAVAAITVTQGGGGYQESPRVRFSGGGNASLTEAYQRLLAGEITDTQYDETAGTPRAQCRIEGPIVEFQIINPGDGYSTGTFYNPSAPPPGDDGKAVPVRFFACGGYSTYRSFRSRSAFIERFAWNRANEPLDGTVIGHPIETGCFTAPASYPGGPISLGQPPTAASGLYIRKPQIVPLDGHLFYIDAVESVAFTSFALREDIPFTAYAESFDGVSQTRVQFLGTVVGSGTSVSSGSDYFQFMRAENLGGKSINLNVVLGNRPRRFNQSIWMSSNLKLSMLRFSEPPTFAIEDVAGSGAVLTTTLDGEGGISGIAFASQGSNYSDLAVLSMRSCKVAAAACEAECVVSPDGRVSHVVVIAAGDGFRQPVAVAHGGRGRGCLLRAVRARSGDAPSGIAVIEVLSGGDGYDQQSPPQVYVYESSDVEQGLRDAFNASATEFPIRRKGTGFAFGTAFATCTSGVFRYAQQEFPNAYLPSSLPSDLTFYPARGLLISGMWSADLLANLTNWRLPYKVRVFNGQNYGVLLADLFVRIGRAKSIRHRASPQTVNIQATTSFNVPATLYNSASAPSLNFSGAYGDEMPSATASFTQHNPNSVMAYGSRYFASRIA